MLNSMCCKINVRLQEIINNTDNDDVKNKQKIN